MAEDALGAHARDELGISDTLSARPIQAAFASAGTFAVGAALPLLLVLAVPVSALVWVVSGSSLSYLRSQRDLHGNHVLPRRRTSDFGLSLLSPRRFFH
jgi:hypothetical protein